MISDEKLALHDRIEVARDILVNIKDDMKIMASRSLDTQDKKEHLLVALKASEAALAANTLAQTVLCVEDKLKLYLAETEDKNGIV